jgi:parvulin-like peptidyl-prolyl isomerase
MMRTISTLILLTSALHSETKETKYAAKNQVVAVVNGNVITMADVRHGMPKQQKPADAPRTEWLRYRLGMFKKILESLIDRKLLYQEAKLANIEILEASLEREIDRRQRSSFASRKELHEYLKKLGVSMRVFRLQIKEDLMAREVIRRRIELDRTVSPSELLKYYEDHISNFTQGEKRRLRIIMIPDKVEGNSGAAFAKNLVAILRKKPFDFARLAKMHSKGPASDEGGDIGWIERDRGFRKELREVGFSLKKGAISDPVPLAGGYFIIKAENISPGLVLSFDDAQPRIREKIQSERYSKDRRKLIDDLRERAYVVTFLPDADLLM